MKRWQVSIIKIDFHNVNSRSHFAAGISPSPEKVISHGLIKLHLMKMTTYPLILDRPMLSTIFDGIFQHRKPGLPKYSVNIYT